MRTQATTLWDIAYLGMLAAGTAVTAIHLTLGLYHLAVIAAVMTAVGFGVLAMEQVTSVARLARPELALLNRAPMPAAPVTVGVVRAEGVCAWGYSPGQSWAIDVRGAITPQLCRAAVAAVAPLLQQGQAERGAGQASCICPLANRQVAFAVS